MFSGIVNKVQTITDILQQCWCGLPPALGTAQTCCRTPILCYNFSSNAECSFARFGCLQGGDGTHDLGFVLCMSCHCHCLQTSTFKNSTKFALTCARSCFQGEGRDVMLLEQWRALADELHGRQ